MRALFILFSFILFTESSLAKIEAVLGTIPLKGNKNLVSLPRAPSKEVIISREQYVISYNKERRSANWVAWKVDASNLGSANRTNKFEQDQDLQQYLNQIPNVAPAVTPEDYRGSCFDRGHQAPSADRTNSTENNQSTFVMSNMLPQTPYLNRYLWEQLERYTRQLVAEGKTVYVITGPVYDQDFGAIGPKNDIPVPSKLFKIVIVKEGQQRRAFAVLMPNVLKSGAPPTNKDELCNDSTSPGTTLTTEWRRYKSTLTEIKKITGLKF